MRMFFSVVIFVILVILLLVSNQQEWRLSSVITVLLSLISGYFMFVLNKHDDIQDKIQNATPIWRFLGVDVKVKFFLPDQSKSVVDNIRYYSLVVDNNHKVISINKLNDNMHPRDVKKVSSQNEIINFYFSSNAIAESNKVYYIGNPLIKNYKKAVPVFNSSDIVQNHDGFKIVNIIKSTTIFSDDTYFFEGDGLSGGIVKVGNKLIPYSGNWNSKCNDNSLIKRSQKYLAEIDKR